MFGKLEGGVICIHPNLREVIIIFPFILCHYISSAGFLSLEEIDEAEYGLNIPDPENHDRKHNSKPEKLNKQKQDCACSGGETVNDESIKSEVKKKKKKKKNKDAKENQKVEHSNTGMFFLILLYLNVGSSYAESRRFV